MKRVAYAALAIALAASSFRFLNETRVGSAPTTPVAQSPPADPLPSGINWSGAKSKVSGPLYLPFGTYDYQWRAIGSGPLVIFTEGVGKDLLVDTTLPDYRALGMTSSYPTVGGGVLSSRGTWVRLHVEATTATWQLHLDRLTR